MKPLSKKEQEEFDAKVADLWRRLDLSELADINDLLPEPKKGKSREEVDREVEQEWIRKNLK